MVIVSGQVWPFWIAVFLVVPSILLVLGVIIGYVYKVVMPRYPTALTRGGRGRLGLAEWVAIRAAGREPFAESYHYDSLAARLRPAHRAGRGAGRGRDRPAVARRPGPGPGHRPRRLGAGQPRRRSSACCGPCSRSSTTASAPSSPRR